MAQVPEERAPGALALFVYKKGPREGQEVEVRNPVATIGQGAENDIVIQDDSVSTRHARIEYQSGAWRITDLHSTNGTYAEGVKLAPEVPTPLLHDAKLRFGGTELDFRLTQDADIESALADFQPTPEPPRVTSRRRFRMPLWLAVVLVLAILIALFVIGWLTTGQGLPVEAAYLDLTSGELVHLLL